MNKTYIIGFGDSYGKCEANNKFNKEILPFLEKLKLEEVNIDKLANLFSNIYDCGYYDGYDTCEGEINNKIM